ncbi:MraY family glycosyltransferase [Propionimicrobium lymphophilum]|uniref:MraY family glycosyltransferase n=1 Tax=Propionimicrobium lymphophilum TaxID=33012 RepID=UPI0004049798|nr:MraY family glycosyltransferase [Propionimicrobium lymphophilum]
MREYLLVLLVSAAATYLFAAPARRLAIRTGAMAKVRSRDVHTVPTPYLGGLAMLGGLVIGVLVASRMPFLGHRQVITQDSWGIVAAALVICLVGVVDDLIELPAVAKIAGQVLAASVAVLNGVRMYWISLPSQIIALDQATSILITVVFIFICVNAINIVDGLDGLAAGVVGIGASALFVYTYVLAREQNFVVATTSSLIAVTTTGICFGFLPHNFYRAKLFMGDTGSMLLGLLLACSSLSLTGQIDASTVDASRGGLLPNWLPIMLPFAIMALPIGDMTLAYIRRTMRGQWWFEADKQHLHHRLVRRSRSTIKAVLIMYVWTALIAYGVVFAGLMRNLAALFVVVLVWLLALLVTYFVLRKLAKLPLPAAGT